MSHNSEDLTIKQSAPIGAPLACQTTARRRKSFASPLLGHLLTPPGCPFLAEYGVKLVSEAL